MFGFGKRAAKSAPVDTKATKPSAQAQAIDGARAALSDAVSMLTAALAEIGIDAGHLADRTPPRPGVLALLAKAFDYDDEAKPLTLVVGKTVDHKTCTFEPFYRYREVLALLEDLTAMSETPKLRATTIQREAPHALLQARLASLFLGRIARTEQLTAAGDVRELERERAAAAHAVSILTMNLPAAFVRGLDLPALRQEWAASPHVTSVPRRP